MARPKRGEPTADPEEEPHEEEERQGEEEVANDEDPPAAAAANPAAADPPTPFTNYLRDTLLFGQELRSAVLDQGITDIDHLYAYSDVGIQQVCKNIRNPGGTIPNPRATDGNTQPPTIPDRGVQMGSVYELRLRHLRYYRWHLRRIQRPWDPEEATLDRLEDLWERHELEVAYKDKHPEYPSPMTKVDDSKKVIEDIDEWLDQRLGMCGSPLAYITRDQVELPDDNEDPGYGLPTLHEELIRRTRHVGLPWEQDKTEVWRMIRHVTHGGPGWNWVSRFARSKNGRDAYFSFKKHYLGDTYVQRTVANADRTLETLFFDGKSRNFTFEHFSAKMNKAFDELAENGEPYSESKKVRKLTTAIRDPTLKAATAAVLASEDLKTNYTKALNYISVLHDTERNQVPLRRNISSLQGGTGRGRGGRGGRGGRSGGRGGRGRGRGDGGTSAFNPNDPGRNYTPREWSSLSADEKAKVRAAREQQRKRKAAALEVTETDTTNQDNPVGVGATMTRRQQPGARQG